MTNPILKSYFLTFKKLFEKSEVLLYRRVPYILKHGFKYYY